MSEWTHISKDLPPPMEAVIVYYADGIIGIDWYVQYLEEFCLAHLHGGVTHWMPVPKPPWGGAQSGR